MILIIPDIHGRDFWKRAVEEHFDKVSKIVFIGDYLDPYPWENITRKQAIANFDEIIKFKSDNKDKVVLLLGNHDFPYIDKRLFYTRSRYDSSNAYHIEGMFRSHRSLFQLAYEDKIGDKLYLFTHAGLIPQWYEAHKDLIGDLTVENLNTLKDTPGGIKSLCESSRYRGGWDRYGSIVWGDVMEMTDIAQITQENEGKTINDKLPWDYQVFGHSQQDEHPIITKLFACLDCRKAFILNDDGGFIEA
jgi:predicted MPP superfamily phosphohydrolase